MDYPKINVLCVMKGFSRPGLEHDITPYRFELQNGEKHKVKEIKTVHRENTGKGYFLHYVLLTDQDRYFNLVFDPRSLEWRLIQEVDKGLFHLDTGP